MNICSKCGTEIDDVYCPNCDEYVRIKRKPIYISPFITIPIILIAIVLIVAIAAFSTKFFSAGSTVQNTATQTVYILTQTQKPTDTIAPVITINPFVTVPPATTSAVGKTWTEVIRFSGSSTTTTQKFIIDAFEWRIKWSIKANNVNSDGLHVVLYNTTIDNSNPIVSSNNDLSGESYVYNAGEYYLQITSQQNYEIIIEELK